MYILLERKKKMLIQHQTTLTAAISSTSLNVIHLNIRSLRGKLHKVTDFLQYFQGETHVLVQNEKWRHGDNGNQAI